MFLISRRFLAVLFLIIAASVSGLYFARPLLFSNPMAEGLAAYAKEDWDTAAEKAGIRLKAAFDDREALRLKARASVRQGNDEAARLLYTRLGGAEAMQAEDFFLFGTLIERSGDRHTALETWEAGFRADSNHPELLNEFVRLGMRNGQLIQATVFADRLVLRPGWEARGNLLRGRIAYELDDPETAVKYLTTGLDLDPTAKGASEPPGQYRKLLARALLRVERPQEAVEQLQKFNASRVDPEVSWLLSRAHLQAGALAEASLALESGGAYRDENPLAPEPAAWVGAARCGECHAKNYQSQQNSHHARTFLKGDALKNLPLPSGPLNDPAEAEVVHEFRRRDNKVELETSEKNKTIQAVADYVFGSGHLGFTMVGRDEKGRSREFRISHYSDGPLWDVTTGHPANPPELEGYLGRFLSADEVLRCISCHATAPRLARDGIGLVSADHAIGCERCHGPGGNHVKAVELKFADLSIAHPKVGSAAQVVALCGRCHSPSGKDLSRSDPLAVRFPATGLTWSRCYTESAGTFDCRSCHNPHTNAETAPAYYEAKCLGCHSAGGLDKPKQAETARASVCSVNPKEGCVGCHMPSVKTAIPHSRFTDHDIRIHARGEVTAKSGPAP